MPAKEAYFEHHFLDLGDKARGKTTMGPERVEMLKQDQQVSEKFELPFLITMASLTLPNSTRVVGSECAQREVRITQDPCQR